MSAPPIKTQDEVRQARLAVALRANLRRRKAAGQPGAKDPPCPDPPCPEASGDAPPRPR